MMMNVTEDNFDVVEPPINRGITSIAEYIDPNIIVHISLISDPAITIIEAQIKTESRDAAEEMASQLADLEDMLSSAINQECQNADLDVAVIQIFEAHVYIPPTFFPTTAPNVDLKSNASYE